MIEALLVLQALVQDPGKSLHYRVDAQTTSTVDASAVGQGVVKQSVTTMALVSVTMHDTAGGKLAEVVIDSATFDAGAAAASGGIPPEMLVNPKGTHFHIYVIDGKMKGGAVPSLQTMAGAQVGAALALMFPGTKPNLKAGDVWVDSVKADTAVSMGGTTRGLSVVSWTAKSGAGGEFELAGTSVGSASAAGPTPMEMTAKGSEQVTTRPGGPASKGSVITNGHGTLNAGGMSIPIDVVTTASLTSQP